MSNWTKKTPFAITITDKNGRIIEMNEKARKTFEKYGENLTGKSLFACHNENSQSKLKKMFEEKSINVYTIEKNGIKKLIYQFPWEDENGFAGYGELSVEIPLNMPHHKRD